MHNYPNCGSGKIQLISETNNINLSAALSGAIIGGIVLGEVGGLIGGLIGASLSPQTPEMNYCLNCGNKWNAELVFQLVEFVSNLIGTRLDLSLETDRSCLAEFITSVAGEMSSVETEKQVQSLLIGKAKESVYPLYNLIIISAWVGILVGLFMLRSNTFLAGSILLLSIYLIVYSSYLLREHREEKQKVFTLTAQQNIDGAERQLENTVKIFVTKYQNLFAIGIDSE